MPKSYTCEQCQYKTHIKTQYMRHLATNKHIKQRTDPVVMVDALLKLQVKAAANIKIYKKQCDVLRGVLVVWREEYEEQVKKYEALKAKYNEPDSESDDESEDESDDEESVDVALLSKTD